MSGGMRPARRLQPRAPGPGRSNEPSLADLIALGPEDDWARADGMVALLSWDALSDALSSGAPDLRHSWLTLTAVRTGASLLLVRAAVMEATPRVCDEQRFLREGFRPREHTGTWLRQVESGDLRAVVRALRGPLEVPHPRDLRFTLLASDAPDVRRMFGPLREQRRRPPGGQGGRSRSGPPCRRCGQPMTDSLSIERGYGPGCWAALTGTETG